MIRVLFVCLGNICRSPMAEAVFQDLVNQAGLGAKIQADSAGTAAYHIGELPDPRTRSTLQEHGIQTQHRAQQVKASDFKEFTYLVAMDHSNFRNIERVQPGTGQVLMMGAFSPDYDASQGQPSEVPDPYYGGEDGFEQVYQMLVPACQNLLNWIQEQHSFA